MKSKNGDELLSDLKVEAFHDVYITAELEPFQPSTLCIELGMGFFYELKYEEAERMLPNVIAFNEEKLKHMESNLSELVTFKERVILVVYRIISKYRII